MKIIMKILFCFFILILPYILQAQSVFIESKKYYSNFKDEYRQDTVLFELPVIIGGVSNDMHHKLAPYLSADSLLGGNIDSVISNYSIYGAGIVGSGYNVLYNKNSVLSISVYVETMGAYPDMFYSDVNLSLNSGKRILITDIIKRSETKKLAAMLDKIVQKRIRDKVKEEQIGEEDALQFFEGDKFSEESLANFAFTDNGIKFYYDYGLPHVIQALSPDEDILMTWKEIEDYVKAGSLLEKILDMQ